MKTHWLLTLCLSWLLAFGLDNGLLAQTDSDGDLNADITDPFPTDPTKGGVYVGGTITYNVLMTGDLDATGSTGTVITIAADGVTFDGNGHKIIAPNAGTVISLSGRSGVVVQNVTVAGNAASPSGTGIDLLNSSNNTVTNSNASYRVSGVHIGGSSSGNIINNNTMQGAIAYGIVIDLPAGATGGNQLSTNDIQNSATGIYIGRDPNFQLSGNIFGNNSRGIWFVGVSGRTISNLTFPTTVSTPVLLDQVTGFTIDNVTVAGNTASPSGTGIDLLNSSNNTVTNSDVSNKQTGIIITGISNNNIVTHNNIFGNGRNISSDQAIELSWNGQGNYWGRACPGPLFVPGTDSNLPNVVDSFPYGSFDGWLSGGPGCNGAPVANAGTDQTVIVNETVQLDGSGSSDPDGDPLTYTWEITSKPAGSNATLSPSIVNPTFVADVAGEYRVSLVVNDGTVNSTPDEVIITVITAQDAVRNLINQVLALNKPQGNGLANGILKQVVTSLDKNDIAGAIDKLQLFIKDVNKFIEIGKFSREEGQPLIDAANAIIAALSTTAKAAQLNSGSNDLMSKTEGALPTGYRLEQNSPNPFNPATSIQFSVPRESYVRLKIYNSFGAEVATLVDRQVAAGTYKVNWDASRLASGFYLYRLEAEGFAQTKKLLLMK